MAHGDYDCCAVCDSKQSYNVDAYAKVTLCTYCAVELALRGVVAHDVDELVDWIQREDAERLRTILTELDFRRCNYPNRVDDLVAARLGREFGRRS